MRLSDVPKRQDAVLMVVPYLKQEHRVEQFHFDPVFDRTFSSALVFINQLKFFVNSLNAISERMVTITIK